MGEAHENPLISDREIAKLVHDFNNVLGLLMLYTDRAIEKAESLPDIRHDLEEIRKGIDRGAALNRDLRAMSRNARKSDVA